VRFRWVALILMSFYTAGVYYSNDNPSEMEIVIEKEFNIGTTEYSLLYSVMSIPNTVLPLFGGIILKRFG